MTKRKLKAIKFPKSKVDDNTGFVKALVNVLARARSGEIFGYAVVVLIDGESPAYAAEVIDPDDALTLIGAIDLMSDEFKQALPKE